MTHDFLYCSVLRRKNVTGKSKKNEKNFRWVSPNETHLEPPSGFRTPKGVQDLVTTGETRGTPPVARPVGRHL